MSSCNRSRLLRLFFTALLVCALGWMVRPTSSDARAGGGQSFGGGSRSRVTTSPPSTSRGSSYTVVTVPTGSRPSSNNNGGGGGGIGIFAVILIIIVIIVIYSVMTAKQKDHTEWIADDDQQAQSDTYLTLADAITRLKAIDPSFSETLFFDFVHLLYTQVQVERGNRNLDNLASFVDPAISEELAKDARDRQVSKVDEVLVGASRISALELEGDKSPYVGIQVEIEANFTEHYAQGGRRIYARERWTFRRRRGVTSKGPKEMSSLTCPSCGAPSEPRKDGSCPYCDRVVQAGAEQWMLGARKVQEVITERQLDLTSTAEEAGTDLPDVMASDFNAARAAFMARNADFDAKAFDERVSACFMGIQTAWSSGRWEAARPFESDHLFNTHRYWIDQYQRQGLTNKLDDIRITRIAPMRFAQDAFYDTITVRIHASLKDYVVDRNGQVVGGNPRADRAFTEYWTFLRSVGSDRAAQVQSGGCPNCGAPLQVSMSGACEYCNTKITTGRFDWVLSSIEQDETYGKDDVALLPGFTPPPAADEASAYSD